LIDNTAEEKYQMHSHNRTKEMMELINNEENLYCLDGDIIDIDGIKFGGAMGLV